MIVIFILASLGVLDAGYLSYVHMIRAVVLPGYG